MRQTSLYLQRIKDEYPGWSLNYHEESGLLVFDHESGGHFVAYRNGEVLDAEGIDENDASRLASAYAMWIAEGEAMVL